MKLIEGMNVELKNCIQKMIYNTKDLFYTILTSNMKN